MEKTYAKQAREKLGLTQKEMAALMSVSRRTWEHWEYGTRRITAAPMKLLSILLWLDSKMMLKKMQKEVDITCLVFDSC